MYVATSARGIVTPRWTLRSIAARYAPVAGLSVSRGGRTIVQSRSVACTMSSARRMSAQTSARNVRRANGFTTFVMKKPLPVSSTIEPVTTISRRASPFSMASLMLRAPSLVTVVGPRPRGPSAETTASAVFHEGHDGRPDP